MKTTLKTIAITLIMLLATLFTPNTVNAQAPEKTYIKIVVDGLSCPFCAYGLEKKIKEVETSKDIRIELEKGELIFTVQNANKPSKDELIKIVKNAGFTAKEIHFSETPFKENTNE